MVMIGDYMHRPCAAKQLAAPSGTLKWKQTVKLGNKLTIHVAMEDLQNTMCSRVAQSWATVARRQDF